MVEFALSQISPAPWCLPPVAGSSHGLRGRSASAVGVCWGLRVWSLCVCVAFGSLHFVLKLGVSPRARSPTNKAIPPVVAVDILPLGVRWCRAV